MLTAQPPLPGRAAGLSYQCEAAAHTGPGHVIPLGAHKARNPRLALRWLRGRAQDVADQLDPPCARPARHWLRDMTEHQRALSALAQGNAYAVTFADDTAHYRLTVHPGRSSR